MAFKSKGIGSAIAGFLPGLIEGYKTGKTLENMAAERALKKQQFQLDVEKASAGQNLVGPDGKVYQTQGISPEAKAALLGTNGSSPNMLPGAVQLGTGKISLTKPDKPVEEVTNVTADEFNANPDLYRNKKIKIVQTPKAPVDPAIQDAKDGLQQIRKIYLTNGSISKQQADLAKSYAKTIGSNVSTEEDQGLMAWVQNKLGSPDYNLVPGKEAPKASKAKASASATMRVKDKKTGQTGTIPTSEFDPNLYDPL